MHPAWLNLIGAMIEGSPLVTGAVPWATVMVSILAGALFVLAAVRVVEGQAY